MRNVTLVAITLATACGPPWAIIRQSATPLTPQTQFAVEAVRFDNLMVGRKTEAEWLSSKKPETQASHAADKGEFSMRFVGALVGHGAGLQIAPAQPGAPLAGLYVRPILVWFEPGYYAVVAHAPTQVRVRVQLVDVQGQVVEEVELQAQAPAVEPWTNVIRASTGERLRVAAEEAGKLTARYLRFRLGLGQ